MTNKLAGNLEFDPTYSSKQLIFQLFCSHESISRAELSRLTGLSKQTVSLAISGLEAMKLVTPVGSTKGHIGRRAITYRLSPSASFAVGIDLGGTSLRSGLIDFSGEVRSEFSRLTPLTNLNDLIQAISNSIQTLKNQAGVKEEIDLLVIGVPGVVHPVTGVVSMAPNVEYLNGIDLRKQLKEYFKFEVIIENDVNLAAVGEKDSLKLEDFVFISLGTGIGMAVVLDGKLRRGSQGGAGEIGYMLFDILEENIQNPKMLEEMLGGKALENLYKVNTGNQLTMEEIFLLAKNYDEYATFLTKNMVKQLSSCLRNIIAILDPTTIIMGGGIGSREEVFSELKKSLQNQVNREIDIRTTSLGSRAGIVGAMSLAVKEIRDTAINKVQKLDYGVTS